MASRKASSRSLFTRTPWASRISRRAMPGLPLPWRVMWCTVSMSRRAPLTACASSTCRPWRTPCAWYRRQQTAKAANDTSTVAVVTATNACAASSMPDVRFMPKMPATAPMEASGRLTRDARSSTRAMRLRSVSRAISNELRAVAMESVSESISSASASRRDEYASIAISQRAYSGSPQALPPEDTAQRESMSSSDSRSCSRMAFTRRTRRRSEESAFSSGSRRLSAAMRAASREDGLVSTGSTLSIARLRREKAISTAHVDSSRTTSNALRANPVPLGGRWERMCSSKALSRAWAAWRCASSSTTRSLKMQPLSSPRSNTTREACTTISAALDLSILRSRTLSWSCCRMDA
mmetsp:Transcript_21491/g.72334  ORF Transcript_21491/g.72334 Transcript_21491/m.72334 type:complete len:352 (-) Transcript_21491:228-1283(-)